MKPGPFRYHAPSTTAQAAALLAELGPEARVLAGGQSLIPLLNMRLTTIAHLVDINGIAELDRVEVAADGVRVWAGARLADVERHAAAVAACPLLGMALRLVAHPVIRYRGTVCGSVAHADPAAELPAVLALLGGTVRVTSTNGPRDVPAADWVAGPFEPALRTGEMVESVFFPAHGGRSVFVEVARRHGDYAVAGVAALVEGGEAKVAVIGAGTAATVVALDGLHGSDAADAVRDAIDPVTDLHASAAYRRHLAGVLTIRALAS